MQRTVTFNPAKWKLVPVEPTEEMINMGNDAAHDGGCDLWQLKREVMNAYQAMLAAAPEYPESEPDRDLRIAEAVFYDDQWLCKESKTEDIKRLLNIIASVGGKPAEPDAQLRLQMELNRWQAALTGLCPRWPKDADDAEKMVRNRIKPTEPINKRLLDAAKVLAALLQDHNDKGSDSKPVFAINDAMVTLGDLRKAREAIAAAEQGE